MLENYVDILWILFYIISRYILEVDMKNKIVKQSRKLVIAAAFVVFLFPQSAFSYSSLVDAISDTTMPDKEYPLKHSETTSAILGNLKGSSLIIDGGENHYGITDGTGNKDAVLKLTSGQSLTVRNIGTYTETKSSSLIEGIEAITRINVGNSWNGFGQSAGYQGAISSTSATVTITDSVFSNNTGQYGGALYNKGTMSITNSVFAENKSTQTGGDRGGSALFNEGTVSSITNSKFYENVGYQGGSLHNKTGYTISDISNSWFLSNKPDDDWGSFSTQADAIWNDGNITKIRNSYFINLRAKQGSAIFNETNGVINNIQNDIFAYNKASESGAVIYNKGKIVNINGGTFLNNSLTANKYGGAIYNSGTIEKITNSTFTDNFAYQSSGVIDNSGTIGEIKDVTIENPSGTVNTNGIYLRNHGVIDNIVDTTIQNMVGENSSGLYIGISDNSEDTGKIGIIDNLTLQNNGNNGIYAFAHKTLQIGKITNSHFIGNGGAGISILGRGNTTVNELSHSEFIENNVSTKNTYGGSINLDNVIVTTINDVSISDSRSHNGGAIMNKGGHIETINGLTISNCAALDEAKNLQNIFANEAGASIGTITNLSIIGGNGAGLSFWGATADKVQQSTITGTTGYGVNVSGRSAAADSYIGTLDNVTISYNARGGIFIEPDSRTGEPYPYLSKIDLIKNSTIINNGGDGFDFAGGIWASTDKLTILSDGVGGVTTFNNNLRRNVSTGIWMDKQNSTLNLQQKNSGQMYMYDDIRGTDNKYYVNISGDKTGTLYLYGDIAQGMTDIQNTKINTADEIIHDHHFATLSSDENSRYVIDVNFNTNNPAISTSDQFTIASGTLFPETEVEKSTTGSITLRSLNFINDISSMHKGQEASFKIINSPVNDLQLKEAFDKEGEHSVLFVLQNDIRTDIDEVKPVTKWDDEINIYNVNTKILGDAQIRTTETTDDTLYIKIESALQDKQKTGTLDTLSAVNQANLFTRSFETTKDNDTYTVKSDLGETNGGNITILGADAVNHSIIDFGETKHYKGFELDSPTNLTIKNVEIKNSSELIIGTSYSANTYIYDSYLHDNGSGISSAGKINIGHTTRIDDEIQITGDDSVLTVSDDMVGDVYTPANVTFNGNIIGRSLTNVIFETGNLIDPEDPSTADYNTGTVTLGSNVQIHETALTLNNITLNVGKNEAFSAVNLVNDNALLNLKNGSTGNQTFNSLTLNNDMYLGIDLDLENQLTDTITVTGDFTTNDHNIVINSVYLMNDALTEAVDIVLTEDNRFEGVYTLSDDLASNIAKAAIVEGAYSIDYSDFGSITGKPSEKGILVITKLDSNSLAMQVVSDEPNKVYGLSKNELVKTPLGLLHGETLAVTGNGSYLVNGQSHSGITLGTGTTVQKLSINDVTSWENFDTAITNGAKGTVEIENVTFESNSAADIDNNGILKLSGTNKFLTGITGSNGTTNVNGGKTTVGSITQNTVNITAGELEAKNITTTSGISNAGTLTLTGTEYTNSISGGGLTKFTNDVSNSGAITQGTVEVASEKTLTTTGDITVNTLTNSGTVTLNSAGTTLTIKGGTTETPTTVAGTINGTGKTKFEEGNAQNSGTIATAVKIATGGKLTTNASNVTGVITNNVDHGLVLTGGNITKNITGSDGSTDITGNVNITGDGRMSQITYILTGGKLTADANKISKTYNNVEHGLVLTGGDINYIIEGTGSTDINTTNTVTGWQYIKQDLNVINGIFDNTNSAISKDVSISENGTLKSGLYSETGTTNSIEGNITNDGTFQLNGGTLNKTISGGGTTIALTNIAIDSNASVEGKFDLNGKTFTMSGDNAASTLNVGTLDGNGNLSIDLLNNGATIVSDAINATTYTSGKTITITTLNDLLGDGLQSFTVDVLKGAPTGVTLALASSITDNTRYKTSVEHKQQAVGLKQNSTWNDKYGTDSWTETIERSISPDGGKIVFTQSEVQISPHIITPNGDTLAALNQNIGTTFTDRRFTTDSATEEYVVGSYFAIEGLGNTGAGQLTVQGVTDGTNTSILNMNSKTGFVVSNANTTLNLKNLNITNIKDTAEGGLINLTGTNSKANLENINIGSTINSSISNAVELNLNGTNNLGTGITGTGITKVNGGKTTVGSIAQNVVNITAGELEVANITTTSGISNDGTLTLTGTANANVITGDGHTVIAGNVNNTGAINQTVEITGELTSTIANLGGTITNTGTLNLSGDLNKTVYGNGTTKVNSNLSMTNTGSAIGTVDLNGGILDLANDVVATTYNIGSIKDTAATKGGINIDIDFTSGSAVADVINLTAGTDNGAIVLNNINPTGTVSTFDEIEILKGAVSGASITLSEAVKTQFNTTTEWEDKYYSDPLTQNATWDDAFTSRTWEERINKTISVVDNTKLKYSQSTETRNEQVTTGDNIALLNQASQFGAVERKYTTDNASKTHTANTGFGTTAAGKLTIQGATDGTNTSTINMNGKDGFNVNSGAEVTLDTVKITGAKNETGSLVNNTAGEINFKNVIADANASDIISNNSTLNIEDSTINSGVTGTGTTNIKGTSIIDRIVQKVVKISEGAKLETNTISASDGIKNSGEMTVKGNMTNNSDIEGAGSLIVDSDIVNNAKIENAITVKSGKSLQSSADNIKNTVANEGIYTVTDGKIANDITGEGSTVINGSVTNNANITNAVTINENKSLTSNANNILGTVSNNGTYEITGGTISSIISGTGNVNITGDVVSNAVNTVSGDVTVAAGKELAIGTNNDVFSSANSVTMGNGSTLNLQNGSAVATNINNVVVGADDTVNIALDWGDQINTTNPANIAGDLQVSSVDLTGTDGSKQSYQLTTTLQDKISLASPLDIKGTGVSNFVKYNDRPTSANYGQLTTYQNSLFMAVTDTEVGEVATYNMTADETAGGGTLEGTLKVQGNGHAITTGGVVIGSTTIQNADLTIEDANLKNITGDAITVYGGNKGHIVANAYDVDISANTGNAIKLIANGTNYAEMDIDAGSKTVNIDNDIVSDDSSNKVTFKAGTININGKFDSAMGVVGDATVNRGGDDDGIDWTVTSGTLNYLQDSYLNRATNTMNLNGGTLNTVNGVVTDFALGHFTLSNDSNFYADVDLANGKMDNFLSTPTTYTGGTLHVAGLNLISDATAVNTSIPFANSTLAGHVDYTGVQGLTALSPIYKYNVGYDSSTGNFGFTRLGGNDGYNPAILAAPVAAQIGGYLTQLQSYDEAFHNMDMYMLMTASQRQALKNKNKIASLDGRVLYDQTLLRQERAEGWFRPYATFEKVGLRNGPKVENTAYGSYMGGESQMYDLGHGWDGMWGAYVGYNGSHQNYDGVSIYQNGGTLGVLGMAYKGNFFTGLTLNAGANGAEASTMYGNENFSMLMAGVASKTGYNWELFNGKFIIQPNMLMSYSFVNTFDYKNAAGVNVDSDPLHAIQLQPELKFIGNLKNGWQPYASVAMVWNIMDDTKFKANDVSLPELSVKPYVKYGVGVRKTWGERFTGFFQTYLTNGGRNGVGLQAGFTWAFGGGKNKKANQKSLNKTPELKKTEIILNDSKVQ